LVIQEVVLEKNLVDSQVAAMLLNITSTNLRQLVFRGTLTPVCRDKRKSQFALADIQAIQARRATRKKIKEAEVPDVLQ